MVNTPAVGAKKKHSEVMQMLFAYNRLIHFNKFENPFGLQVVKIVEHTQCTTLMPTTKDCILNP
jgi:hypothetical protein